MKQSKTLEHYRFQPKKVNWAGSFIQINVFLSNKCQSNSKCNSLLQMFLLRQWTQRNVQNLQNKIVAVPVQCTFWAMSIGFETIQTVCVILCFVLPIRLPSLTSRKKALPGG